MEPSYRIVPAAASKSSAATEISSTAAPSAPVHDSLRHGGPRNLVSEAHAVHPLQHRLQHFDDTQAGLKLQMLGDLYGMQAPLRRMMEKSIVGKVRPGQRSGSRAQDVGMHSFVSPHSMSDLHASILDGTDEILTPADVLVARREADAFSSGPGGERDLHAAMQRQLKMA